MTPALEQRTIIALILKRVGPRHRLCTCALVSKVWAAAAAEATDSINFCSDDARRASCLFQWIQKHGDGLNSISIDQNTCQEMLHHLPCCALKNLVLSHTMLRLELSPSTGQLLVLQAATSLSRLELKNVTVCGDPERLLGLSALQNLQQLSIDSSGDGVDPVHRRYLLRLPSKLIPQMKQVKHLQLCQAVSQLSDLSQLSRLTGLRHLDINFGMPGGPGCVTALPPSEASAAVFSILQALTALTGLRLADTHLPLNAPNASSLSTLTALQHLALEDCPSLDPALLRPLTNLKHLQISHTDLAGGAAGTADFLTWLSRLQGLTHLDLSRSMWRPNAAAANPVAYPAFTASSSLQILDLTAAWLPSGAWAGIFSPSRQLLQLTSLRLVNMPISLSSSDLASLVACCPGVRSLDLARSGSYGDELSVFQKLTSLTKLSVACSNHQVATTVLPKLMGLRDLRLGLLSRVKVDRLSPLTTMTQLTMLTVGSLPRDDQYIFHSSASQDELDESAAPVYRQLLRWTVVTQLR